MGARGAVSQPFTVAEKKQRHRRTCLCCKNEFLSDGPGNRLCCACNRACTSQQDGLSEGRIPGTIGGVKIRQWTAEEDAILQERRARGDTFDEIAVLLGRSRNSVLGRAIRQRGVVPAAQVAGQPTLTRESRARVLGEATGISGSEVIERGLIR